MISIPFSGSKKYSYNKVKAIVEQGNYNSVYEPFGGSCILSVNLFNDGLVEKAYSNDYDHFFDEYETYLDLKDKVVEEGYKAGLKRTNQNVKHGAYYHDKNGNIVEIETRVLYGDERQVLQDIISKYVPEKFWYYFALGNNFTYSTKSARRKIYLREFILFSNYLKTDKQRNYLKILNQITLEHLDYRDFIDKYRNNIDENSLLIIDPPYPNDRQIQYEGMFTEKEAKELINTINELPCDYIYFHGDFEEIKCWFNKVDYTTEQINRHNTNKQDYLIYVHKTH